MGNYVLGVLAGRDLIPSEFKLWAENAYITVAADSGAQHFFELGLRPQMIVGDFDSLPSDIDLSGIDLYRNEDQNFSDCDKLLSLIENAGHRSVVIAGVEGDRLDHLLSSLSSCVHSSLRVRLALRGAIGDILKPGEHFLTTPPGRRMSAMPLTPVSGLDMEGVVWPLHQTTLAIGGQVSLSNVAESSRVRISFSSGALLMVQPRTLEELPDWDIFST